MQRVRVLVVDGSAPERALIAETLTTEPAVELVGTADTPAMAYAKTAALGPDVVVLDGDLDSGGLARTVLAVRNAHPGVVVVLVASPTAAGARTTVDALDAGIADYVTKPPPPRSAIAVQKMVLAHLLPRVKALTGLAPPMRPQRRPEVPGAPAFDRATVTATGTAARTAAPTAPAARMRPAAPAVPVARVSAELSHLLAASGVDLGTPRRDPKPARTKGYTAVLVGASTGGPEALAEFVRGLDPALRTPVLVVQHMPAGFTKLLAERLDRLSHLDVREAVDGDRVLPGMLLVCPGGVHMELQRAGSGLVVRLTEDPPENFVRPAVDVLFRTGAAACGDGVLAVVLTGMGRDGERGARDVQDAGGTVIAQDERTSVVWGMPGCVARADLADAVLPLPRIGADVSERVLHRP